MIKRIKSKKDIQYCTR